MPVRIGIVGDFNPAFHTHPAIESALQHAANRTGIQAQAHWVPTGSLTGQPVEALLSEYDGLWLAPGSPYQSMQGALASIRFARERNWPFVGT